ncbi:MAG: type II secretion system GspH family protein [Zoogloeaceae bacterium]|jgi:prepilin-type N-terminal cleavage/methylation domain-containing protein|nr:type II secretion system GspH family protein [Zoogloeaceae bacterium]
MPAQVVARKAGFTLVELLVVVAILSAVALASFGMVTENRARVRIDDTRNRLAILRRAIVGPESPVYGGEMRLAGYVADNGRLPGSLAELLSSTNHMPQGGVKARFSGSDGVCTVPSTAGTEVDHVAARVLKGHRGNYLAGVVHNGEFRDGWGNVGWGWDTTNVPTGVALGITSFGADNATGITSVPGDPATEAEVDIAEAEADQTMSIGDADWWVPLDGWSVTLRNAGDEDLGTVDFGGDLKGLGLALLVFENVNGGQWRQYRSDLNSCSSANGGEDKDALASGGNCVLGFTSTASCGSRVPLGRHVLVLTIKNATDNTVLAGGALGTTVKQVDFFPGAHPPNLVWAFKK